MIIFDLDGTLSDCSHRQHLVQGKERGAKDWDRFYAECINDKPNKPVLWLFKLLVRQRCGEVQIWSGRSEAVRPQTESWFRTHSLDLGTHCVPLLMRPVQDHRPDTELKAQWLEEAQQDGWRVDFVVEDRARVVAMWRAKGIVCLQCAPGEF